MQIPKSQLIALALLFLLVVAGGYFWTHRETPDTAIARLNAQNIEVNTANFLAEIKAQHEDNVKNFLQAGASAEMQDDNGYTALMAAVETGNKNVLMLVLQGLPKNAQEAANVLNMQDKTNNNTALILAVQKDNADAVSQLLAKGADTGTTDKQQMTPLMVAVTNKYANIIPELISTDQAIHQGASLNASDIHGETPLSLAIRAHSTDIFDTLIAAKADGLTPDRSGVIPLMVAAEAGDTTIGEKLVDMGAKPDSADKSGNTPLSIAIRHGHTEFAKMLLDKGADADFHTSGPLPIGLAMNTEPFNPELFALIENHTKQMNHVDASVMFDAITHRNEALVKTLLDHGINARAVNSKGETALYQAIESGFEDIAILLIDKGADVNQTGIPGITPIERALRHDEVKVVNKLLTQGVQPDQRTSEGYNLAEMAVYSGHPEILDLLLAKGAKLQKDFGVLWSIHDGGGKSVPVLLKYGAHPNVMSNDGDPALWLAASAGETEAVAALIKYRAAIDYPNTTQGMTPLGIASHGGQLDSARLLVDAGAKIDAPDTYGMTPLAQAAYMSKPDVVEYLISRGANIHATDKQGRSVSDLAALGEASEARDRVIALLRQKK